MSYARCTGNAIHTASSWWIENIGHEDEYGIDKDIEIDFDMDVKEGIWKPAKNGRYRYRLSSYTCLAGDIIGDYQFGREINVGDRLVFEDMAIYSMVKNNTFNGIPLPDIVITAVLCMVVHRILPQNHLDKAI